ncbi:hypothetical protein ABZX40_16285 [Streptomyces sp. NPDC004610]
MASAYVEVDVSFLGISQADTSAYDADADAEERHWTELLERPDRTL